VRQGRFGKKTISPERLRDEADLCHAKSVIDWQNYKTGKIHPAVFIGNYLIEISKTRLKNLWLGAKKNNLSTLGNDPFLNFWGNHVLRGVPWKVNHVLIHWYLDHYDLQLIDRVVSSKEMLLLQSQGKRYLTFLLDKNDWLSTVIHGRDHYSLVIHDLIHAYEFFANQKCHLEQVQFYQMLLSKFDYFLPYLTETNFSNDFSYLISDMNSHPAHLESYLQSLCDRNNIISPLNN